MKPYRSSILNRAISIIFVLALTTFSHAQVHLMTWPTFWNKQPTDIVTGAQLGHYNKLGTSGLSVHLGERVHSFNLHFVAVDRSTGRFLATGMFGGMIIFDRKGKFLKEDGSSDRIIRPLLFSDPWIVFTQENIDDGTGSSLDYAKHLGVRRVVEWNMRTLKYRYLGTVESVGLPCLVSNDRIVFLKVQNYFGSFVHNQQPIILLQERKFPSGKLVLSYRTKIVNNGLYILAELGNFLDPVTLHVNACVGKIVLYNEKSYIGTLGVPDFTEKRIAQVCPDLSQFVHW